MNNQEIIETLNLLSNIYAGFDVINNKTAYTVWKQVLEPFNAEEVSKATRLIIENETYPPNPAMIKQYVDRVNSLNQPSALDLFKSAVSMYGSYQHQQANAYIMEQSEKAYEVIKSIGYYRLCQMDQEDAFRKIKKAEIEHNKANNTRQRIGTQQGQHINLLEEGLRRARLDG